MRARTLISMGLFGTATFGLLGCKSGMDRAEDECLAYVNATDTDERLASADKCLKTYVAVSFDKDPSYDPFKVGGEARTLHESSVLGHIESACVEAKQSGDDAKRRSCAALCKQVSKLHEKYPHFYVGRDVNPPAGNLPQVCASLDVLIQDGRVASKSSRPKLSE